MAGDLRAVWKVCNTTCVMLEKFVGGEETIAENFLKKQIGKFFGALPGTTTEWGCNLWTGNFFPILAYVSFICVAKPKKISFFLRK